MNEISKGDRILGKAAVKKRTQSIMTEKNSDNDDMAHTQNPLTCTALWRRPRERNRGCYEHDMRQVKYDMLSVVGIDIDVDGEKRV